MKAAKCYNFIIIILVIILYSFSCSTQPQKEIENIQKTYSETREYTPYSAKVFFTDFSKSDKDYISFNDGVYYFLYFGDNYKYQIGNYHLISNNTRKAHSKPQYVYNVKNITDSYIVPSNELIDGENISEISDIPKKRPFDIIRRLETRGPLCKEYRNKFNYLLDTCDNNLVLSFSPKGDSSTLEGKIYYQDNKYYIDSIVLETV